MSDLSKIAELIRDIKFAQLTTITEEGHLHAHPMTTQQQEFDGDVWFIGSKATETVQHIAAQPQVNLSYSDTLSNNYVSINGTAELIDDTIKLKELWSDAYNAFFEQGIDDPNIQLIKVHANGAEYWEGKGKLNTLIQLTKARFTGESKLGELGENTTVKL